MREMTLKLRLVTLGYGDTIDIFPSYSNSYGIRIEFFGNEVDSIKRINPVTNSKISDLKHIMISPAKHFVMPEKKLEEL